MEGTAACYQSIGKRKLLDAAMRFADFIDQFLSVEKEKCKGYQGHENAVMAFGRLYEKCCNTVLFRDTGI